MMPPPTMPISVSLTGQTLTEALAVFGQIRDLQEAGPATLQGLQPELIQGPFNRALNAAESVAGLVTPQDVAAIRRLWDSGDRLEALQRLSALHGVLQVVHEECTVGLPAAANLPLERIAPLFGLPAHEFQIPYGQTEPPRPTSQTSALHPGRAERVGVSSEGHGSQNYALTRSPHLHGHVLVLPFGRETAEGVLLQHPTVSARHAELQFSNGRYWLEDKGSTNGTFVAGRRLRNHEKVELKNGAEFQIGPYRLRVGLPYEVFLQEFKTQIEKAVSYKEIFVALKESGFEALVPAIRQILLSPASAKERIESLRALVPYDGGLLPALEAVLLRGEVVRLRSLFFQKATPEQALEFSVRLTASLAQAQSFADLADRLRRTNAQAFHEWISRVERFPNGGGNFADIPLVFGIREQVQRLFLEGLSLSGEQRQDLLWRGATPDVLVERPWKKLKVPSRLREDLKPFQDAMGKRLNREDWQKAETTIALAYANEQDEPRPPDAEPIGATMMVLYDKYQNNQPSGSVVTSPKTESGTPGFFDRVMRRLIDDRVGVMPDGYWFFGGTVGPAKRFEGRIYLSLRRRHAEAIFRYLSGVVNKGIQEKGGQIQFKIAGSAEGYSRSDSGVIYFHADQQKSIYEAMVKMHREHPEFFKEGHPLFTMPLRNGQGNIIGGLSFGEHPRYEQQSFGEVRTQAMTTAVRTVRALMGTTEPPDWEEMQQICAYFLKRAGIDIENPAFNADGRGKFAGLIALCVAAAPAPSPLPAAAPAANAQPPAHPVLRLEIHQRYPVLAAADMAPLVEKMTKDMFARWQGDKRFPGLEKAGAAPLPEDIFDAVVQEVQKAMAGGNYSPRIKEVHKQMQEGDQGPRVVRGLKSKLAIDLPSLASNSVGAQQLAWDIYRHWQTAKDLSAQGLKNAFLSRLRGLRDFLKANPAERAAKPRLQALLDDLERFLK